MTMTLFYTLAQILGGIGIFLLAIGLLTQGLQMVSGQTLRRVLERWTRAPWQGLFLGAGVTALLQSSSAVTAMTIGFVNASIMNLRHALWVIFGANVGTTMTGWLVSLTGFDFDIKVFALPFIGAGMLMKTFSSRWKMQAIGTALTGFGLFFVGVDILKDAFAAYSADAGFTAISQSGVPGLLLLVGIGFVMTLMTQSSSAATALILTGTAGGMLDLSGGAAMVIGANLGTTSTAVIAVLGASANARRVAAGHVIFNALTAAVALCLLPLLLVAVVKIEVMLGIPPAPVTSLAFFHTVFNVLGVLLMIPLAGRLARFLERRFVTPDEIDGRPVYIDSTTAAMPAMALGALISELGRLKNMACESALAAITAPLNDKSHHTQDKRREALSQLSARIAGFSADLAQQQTPEDITATLRSTLRVSRYLRELSLLSTHARDLRCLTARITDAPTRTAIDNFMNECAKILSAAAHDEDLPAETTAGFSALYQSTKESLLDAGIHHRLSVDTLSPLLDHLSALRRMMEQAMKAQRYMGVLGR